MLRTFLLVLLLILIASFPFISDWYTKSRLGDGTQMNIEKEIENYLERHPEKIIESVSKYQKKQFEEQQKNMAQNFKAALQKNQEKLLDFNYPSVKNKEGAVTVVEFFDSSCGYCKKVNADLTEVMNNNKEVNYIFRNFPILGSASTLAAKYENAVFMFAKEEKMQNPSEIFLNFHKNVLSYNDKYNDDVLLKFVSDAGIDQEKFKKFLADNDYKINQMITETERLAKELSINGTPAFIVGDQLLPGAADKSRLEASIKKASTN